MMALRGVRVVEMAGLAPAPFAGMILAGITINFNLFIVFLLKLIIISYRFWCLSGEGRQA